MTKENNQDVHEKAKKWQKEDKNMKSPEKEEIELKETEKKLDKIKEELTE